MKKRLMVKQVIRADILQSGTKCCFDQPQKDQLIVDDDLIISGWVVGETSLIDKISISGGVSAEIPVDIDRPDVLLHLKDSLKINEILCPLIEGTLRCGFAKKIPLKPMYSGTPVEISAMSQSGGQIPLAVITFVPAPEPVSAIARPKSTMRFYYFDLYGRGYYIECFKVGRFLYVCGLLSRAYPSTEWPDLTAMPLPKERENQRYDVFVPVREQLWFAKQNPSLIDQLPDYVIEDLNDKKCSLIFDYSNEPANWGLCVFIRNGLQARGLQNFSNVLLLTPNGILHEVFTDFYIYPFNYYVIQPAISLYEQLGQTQDGRLNQSWKDEKTKNILCMNYTPRLHRYFTVATLIKKGYLTNSLISFLAPDNDMYSPKISIQDLLDFCAKTLGLQNIDEAMQWLIENAPLKIDEIPETELKTNASLLNKIDFSAYEQTLLAIVTESDIHDDIQRITEKSLKAFALGHPSVIIGSPYSIKLVEELGFDVFHEFIDHSYDQIGDWVLRMNTAIDEAVRFCEAYRNGSIDIDKLQAISQKNRDWLRSGFFEHYSKKYAFPILSALASKY